VVVIMAVVVAAVSNAARRDISLEIVLQPPTGPRDALTAVRRTISHVNARTR